MSDNPVSYLLNKAGVRPSAFEERCGISHTAMTNVVAGTFNKVPPKIKKELLTVWEDRADHSAAGLLFDEYGTWDIDTAYILWKRHERYMGQEDFQCDVTAWDTVKREISPVRQYIFLTARYETTFAKKLKVPTATVTRWASGATAKLPDAILQALLDVGYAHLQELMLAQDEWREKWGL